MYGGLFASVLLAAFAGVSLPAHAQDPVVSCASLAKRALPDAVVTSVQTVGAGAFKVPAPDFGPPAGAKGGAGGRPAGGAPPAWMGQQGKPQPLPPNPAFCRVSVTATPSSDSDIKIEIWLPLKGWNGKFVGVGNSGWAGSIPYRNMVPILHDGYALAGTDTGHTGNSGAFLIGHPQKFIDYAYRADHEMTLKAKAIVAAFYGHAPRHSYWVGCSLGGQEALQEARRYPADYDGIVAGAPVNPLSRLNAAQLWPAWVNLKYPQEAIPAHKFIMIHQAALKACASAVGQKQGFVDDPDHCRFDPQALLCRHGDAPDCLTAPQVDLLRKLYAGPVNPRTGESIFPGMPVGGELVWAADNGGAKPIPVAVDLFKYAVYKDPDWDWKTMDYDTSMTKAYKEVDPLLYADPQLNAFLNRGDRLMLYIGAAEYHSFKDMEAYYDAVLKNAGPGKAGQVRLFVVPGMGHCGGGAGCDTFEKLGTMDQWVQSGRAPEVLISSKMDGDKVIRTRPLCAYPLVARYKGSGDEDNAASFECMK